MGGSAVRFEEWPRVFAGVDILIGSTAAPHHVLTRAQLEPLLGARRQRPLFCIDLAVPRDIEPEVNLLNGVYLYDIDSLQAIAQQSMEVRRGELQSCEAMIDRHVGEFLHWLRSNPALARESSTRLRGGAGELPAHGV
jgi:glutamyl-tRNA reductase